MSDSSSAYLQRLLDTKVLPEFPPGVRVVILVHDPKSARGLEFVSNADLGEATNMCDYAAEKLAEAGKAAT